MLIRVSSDRSHGFRDLVFNVIEHDGDNLRDELSHGTDKLPPKNWSLRNMPSAPSVRERAKLRHSRMRPPLLMKA